MNFKVSVIIPVFNVEKYLGECLDSVLSQTLKDIEIICINDGSKDNSLSILEEYSKKDKRVKIINQENSGQSKARNIGLSVAKGEYISFVDSDDYIDSTMLEKLYTKAKKYDADISVCDLWLYYMDTERLEPFRDPFLLTFLKNKAFSIRDYTFFINFVGVWDRIYKRNLIETYNLQYPIGLVYEDHLFTYQATIYAKRIVVTNEKLYYYRKNAGDSITDREKLNDKFKFDYLEISRLSKKFFTDQNIYDIVKNEYLLYQFHNAFMHQKNATTIKSFKRIFNEMQALTTKSDYKTMKEASRSDITLYANMLKKNQLMKCYIYCLFRKQFSKINETIYFRLPILNKKIKIRKCK